MESGEDWLQLDPEALEPLRAVDPDGSAGFLSQVLDLYLVDSLDRLAEARSALASDDSTTLRRAGHSLKTLGATIGAVALAAAAARLEAAAREGDQQAAAAAIEAIAAGLPITNGAVTHLRSGMA